jgi:hypothetical protein
MTEHLVQVAHDRAVTRMESLGGYAIELGNLSEPELTQLYDNIQDRRVAARQPYKREQCWNDLVSLENYLGRTARV